MPTCRAAAPAAAVTAMVRLVTYASDMTTFAADAAIVQLQRAAGGVLYLDGGWAQLISGLAVLQAHLACAGVREEDVVTSRFLARMAVAGAAPMAARGGYRSK
jgi:hypothetical protein